MPEKKESRTWFLYYNNNEKRGNIKFIFNKFIFFKICNYLKLNYLNKQTSAPNAYIYTFLHYIWCKNRIH